MIGMKVFITGMIVSFTCGAVMSLIGRQMPSMWIAAPLIAGALGGIAAAVFGLLWWVWA